MRTATTLKLRFVLIVGVLTGAVVSLPIYSATAQSASNTAQSASNTAQSAGEAAQNALEDAQRAIEAAQSALESSQNPNEAAQEKGHSEPIEPGSESPAEPNNLDFLFYGGKFVDSTYRRVLFEGDTNYQRSYVWVAGLNYKLGQLVGPITIETEGQVARHTGIQDNWEINALVIARMEWVWENKFSFSVAQGDGFSLASERPKLEVEDSGNTNVFLQYLLTEIVFGFPSISWHPRFLIRIHHRSGSFGIHCSATCGSNFITYGLKGAF